MATSAWVYSRFSATLILCWSVLESLIIQKADAKCGAPQYLSCNEYIDKAELLGLLQEMDVRNAGKIMSTEVVRGISAAVYSATRHVQNHP